MERVQKITFMAAVFMFLSEMRPFEPYRSAYLTGPDENISLSEVNNTLYMYQSNYTQFQSYKFK